MVGQGVLRECLHNDRIDGVLAIGRSSTGRTHQKLRELIRADLFDFGGVAVELQDYDACFFCLGVSSAGMNEADYTRLTFDLTLGWAQLLAQINPTMTFVYVSGAGTGGKAMWSQVKGRTENALLELFPLGVHVSHRRPARYARRDLENALDTNHLCDLPAALALGSRDRAGDDYHDRGVGSGDDPRRARGCTQASA